MGGIGKTSLARHVFNLHCHEFNRRSFVENISKRWDPSYRSLDVQKQLCDGITKPSSFPVHDVSVYTSTIENALARKKAFVVLDDIDSLDQLDVLLGNKGFHPGSKIIITTRDASLTERCALFNLQVQPKHTKHNLKSLHVTDSLKLLCLHAFGSEDLKEGYKAVSDNIVNYCEGHPLALKVLGRSLRNQNVAYWEDRIKGLKKQPNSDITDVFRMSFESLPSENDKELFKHIACYFVGKDRDFTEKILDACDIRTISGITHLIDRCLLDIGRRSMLSMHSLIQEMGRDEVRRESPYKPWKRSRLWCHEESFNVLEQKKGKGNLRGLSLDMRMLEKEKLPGSSEPLETAALSNMHNLMILHLDYVQINGPYENFPKKIGWLRMCGFSLKSIPSELPMENLVVLDMSYSNIEFFDMSCSSQQRSEKRQKLLRSLKILDLSFSKQLRHVGGFCKLPSLESLFLSDCWSLIEICESIDHCDELVFIDLSNCKDLRKLPRTLIKLKKVKTLLLAGCNKFELTDVEAVPRDFKSSAVCFPSSLVKLSLANNNLSNESFPMDFSSLSMLEFLRLDKNPIVSMPDCVRTLPRLKELFMNKCVMLGSIEHPPHTLRILGFLTDNRYKNLIRKISFDREMSTLNLHMMPQEFAYSSLEIEGIMKIQPIAGVDDTILYSLGWSNLEFIYKRHVGTYHFLSGPDGSQTQMYYEFGIFSTIYGGEVMPNWIRHKSKGPSISFTIPSSPNKLRGLNLCYVRTLIDPYWRSEDQDGNSIYPHHQLIYLPRIKISNITKNLTWLYIHHIDRVNAGGKSLTFLSHWMFGENEMENGDQVTISIEYFERSIRECGVSFVFDDGKNEKEEDPLSYYKSWNHIIGGDLSPFRKYNLYYLDNHQDHQEAYFKAFSQKNSNTRGRAIEDALQQSGGRARKLLAGTLMSPLKVAKRQKHC